MISLSSTTAMLAAVGRARSVTFCAYVLRPGPVERALEAAARRGARVQVRLDGYLWAGTPAMSAANRACIAALRRAGADARLVHRTDGDGPGLHLKAAVCDGAAFLDDCNWNLEGDTVLRDDASAHVRAIRAAAGQRPVQAAGALALDKAQALAAETQVLERPSCRAVEVETEALHASALSAALRRLAARGVRCRVLVSERALRSDLKTRSTIASLERSGVRVRAARSSEKFAVADRSRAWAGSADATSTFYDGDRIEWSLRIGRGPIVRALEARFNSRWIRSKIPA